jgi:hypothetical protein
LATEIRFSPPVGIYFGRPGQTRIVSSLREAAECMMSGKWPDISGAAFERALRTFVDATEGRESAEQARADFVQAVRESGILAERDDLRPH